MWPRQPSYGLFATALEPQYWFGVPRAVRFAGLGMDVDLAAHDFHGWIGEGYIIEDPATGSGAYKIAGGGNGSLLDWI